jgi:hypothetical protein
MNRICAIIISCLIVSCSDSNATQHQTIQIGMQTWMKNNLRVVTFRNGDTIPEAKTDEEWNQARFAEKAAWCYVKNNADSDTSFGKLYNWYAVNDPRGLAPAGWHIPTDAEWTELLGKNNGIMFAVQRAGTRTFAGPFENEGWGFWWSATGNESYDHQYAWYRVVGIRNDFLHRDTYVKGSGFSVRCLKNTEPRSN